jgi:hypothetical protein
LTGAPDHAEPDAEQVMVYAWGNNPRRASLVNRRCVVFARGTLGSVLVRFLDTGEKVVTARRSLRRARVPVGP